MNLLDYNLYIIKYSEVALDWILKYEEKQSHYVDFFFSYNWKYVS